MKANMQLEFLEVGKEGMPPLFVAQVEPRINTGSSIAYRWKLRKKTIDSGNQRERGHALLPYLRANKGVCSLSKSILTQPAATGGSP